MLTLTVRILPYISLSLHNICEIGSLCFVRAYRVDVQPVHLIDLHVSSLACNSKRFFLIKLFTISAIQLACSRAITLSKMFTIIFTVWIFSPKCQTCLFQSANSLNEKHNITEVKCRKFQGLSV